MKQAIVGATIIALAATGALAQGTTRPAAPGATPPASAAPAGPPLAEPACTSAWQKAGPKSDALDMTQAKAHVRDFKQVDLNGDNRLDVSEWKTGCSKGLIVAGASEAGTRPAGAKPGGTGTSPAEHPPTNRMNEAVPPMKSK